MYVFLFLKIKSLFHYYKQLQYTQETHCEVSVFFPATFGSYITILSNFTLEQISSLVYAQRVTVGDVSHS